MNVPTLDYTISPEAVASNRKLISEARVRLKAELRSWTP